MINPNTQGSDDECFTIRIQDVVLQHAPSALFGSLMAMFAPCVGCHINDITMMVVSLGEAESHHQQEAFQVISQIPSVSWSNSAPVQVTRTQMWSDILGAGVD